MGSIGIGVCMCIVLQLCGLVVALKFNIPQAVNNGVLVPGGGDIRSNTATWTLFVTLDAPRPEVTLQTKIQQLRLHLHSELVDHSAYNLSRWSWMQILHAIEAQIPPAVPTGQRNRRGLFDLGGVILNKLFGTATSAEVEESRHWIEQMRGDELRIVNKTSDGIESYVSGDAYKSETHPGH